MLPPSPQNLLNKLVLFRLGGIAMVLLFGGKATAKTSASDCAVKMEIPVSLVPSTIKSPEFAVKHKGYVILLRVDSAGHSIWDTACLLGNDPSRLGIQCSKDSMVQLKWTVWDGQTQVAEGVVSGNKGDGEFFSERELGSFMGEAKKKYTVEVTFTKDGGILKEMKPRLVVRQEYDFWCSPM